MAGPWLCAGVCVCVCVCMCGPVAVLTKRCRRHLSQADTPEKLVAGIVAKVQDATTKLGADYIAPPLLTKVVDLPKRTRATAPSGVVVVAVG